MPVKNTESEKTNAVPRPKAAGARTSPGAAAQARPATGARTVSASARTVARPKSAVASSAKSAAPVSNPRTAASLRTAAGAKPASGARTSAAVKKAAPAKPPVREQSRENYYGESSSLMAPVEEKKGVFKNKKIILFSAAGLLSLLLLVFAGRGIVSAIGGGKKSAAASARDNTLTLVQKYLDKGQYDKAMDLLNGLLISNPNDAEADELLDKAIQLKKESDERAAAQSVVVQPGDSSYNINIDTDEITNALREQNERSQQMINDLLEQQRQTQNAQREEAAAERKAAEELKKKEETERKAKEAELAQKNAVLKSKIGDINEKILAGRADLNTGSVESALRNFDLAISQLPLSEGEPEFSAAKYSEIASALYEASSSEKDPAKRDKLRNSTITYVNKSLGVNPSDPVSHYILGMNYGESSPPNWAKAAEELEKAVKSAGDNYMYWYQLGRAQYRLKNYERARTAFQNSAKYNNKFDLAYFNLGMTLKRLKLNKDALSAFRSAHSANSQNSKAYLEEARLLQDVYKDSAGSVNCYKKVIELDPVNVSALNECGVVYSNMGQFANAETCHRKAVSLLKPGDKDPITYYNLALALYNQKKNSEAEKYAQLSYEQKDAVKSDKEKAVVVYNYALVEDSLGKSDKAIALYKEVLKLDPDNAKTKTNLGVMFMAMGDADTALVFFLDAYKIDKNFELENNLGSAYLSKKDYSNAITHFQNALKKSPKDHTVRFNLAKCYAEAGDFDNAKTAYLDILSANEKNYDAYIELSKVFIALKDTASAKSYLDILRQKSPTYRKPEVDSLLAAIGN